MMEVVVTTTTIICAMLQTNRHNQQTKTGQMPFLSGVMKLYQNVTDSKILFQTIETTYCALVDNSDPILPISSLPIISLCMNTGT